jgi:uncharacterized membrane protein
MDQDELDKHIRKISEAASRINFLINGLAIAVTVAWCFALYRMCR